MSKIKKVTAVLLSVIMLVCMFSVPAGAESKPVPHIAGYMNNGVPEMIATGVMTETDELLMSYSLKEGIVTEYSSFFLISDGGTNIYGLIQTETASASTVRPIRMPSYYIERAFNIWDITIF